MAPALVSVVAEPAGGQACMPPAAVAGLAAGAVGLAASDAAELEAGVLVDWADEPAAPGIGPEPQAASTVIPAKAPSPRSRPRREIALMLSSFLHTGCALWLIPVFVSCHQDRSGARLAGNSRSVSGR